MSSVEDRLSALETEVALLRKKLAPDPNWISKISGSMQDYPEFDEVLRLGREIRKADRPSELGDEN